MRRLPSHSKNLIRCITQSRQQCQSVTQNKQQYEKAYNIYPYLRAQEQEKQACYLTKTIRYHGLPTCFSDNPPSNIFTDEQLDDVINLMMKKIIEVNFFHRDGELKLPKRWRDARKQRKMDELKYELGYQVLMNMLNVLWTNTTSSGQFIGRNFSFRPDIRAPWERFNKKLLVTGKIGHLIRSKSPLPLFSSFEDIEKSRDTELLWDDVISPFFDLHEAETIFEANSGFHTGSPFPYPHTLILMNDPYWFTRMNTGQAVFYSFAHAMTHALESGAQMGGDLDNPVAVQCLVFNGTSFYFVCYQLNTLDFSEDEKTIKNFAWILPDQYLYEKVHDKKSECMDYIDYTSNRVSLMDYNRKVLTETFKNTQTKRVFIEKFNRETTKLFIDFILNRVVS